jgi:nucleoside phosphorylase
MEDEHVEESKFLLHLMRRVPFPQGDLWKNEKKQAALGLIWCDLLTRKIELLSPPTPIAERKDEGAKPKSKALRKLPDRAVDVLVICPLAKELNPSLHVFDLDPLKREDRNLDGHKVYYAKIPRRHGRDLHAAITVVTKQRNIPSALATTAFILKLNPAAIFLSGIGAGVKDKVRLGDVVVSTRVIDIAGGRAEPDKIKSRDNPFTPPSPMDKYVDYFNPERKSWRDGVIESLARIRRKRRYDLRSPSIVSTSAFDIHPGIIVVGEQLVADGSLPLYLQKDDRIRSCEMEGSGFAQACQGARKPWLVFRGISDFGDPIKNDKWQTTAAIVAAKAVRAFLESEYRLPAEVETLF